MQVVCTLLCPSQSVVGVCTVTERCTHLCVEKQRNQNQNGTCALPANCSFGKNKLSQSSGDHYCVVDVFESHVLNLVCLLTNAYVNIRFYSVGKVF